MAFILRVLCANPAVLHPHLFHSLDDKSALSRHQYSRIAQTARSAGIEPGRYF